MFKKGLFKIWVLIIVVVIIVGGVLAWQFRPEQMDEGGSIRAYPTMSNFDFYSIHEIQRGSFTSGTYNTEGFVVKIYTCPSCPNGTPCKPCMRDNIVISESNKTLDVYSLTENELIIFVKNPKQFELGKKYRFSIRILDYKSTGEPINDIEVVGYGLMESPSKEINFFQENETNIAEIKNDLLDQAKVVATGYLVYKTKSCDFRIADELYLPEPLCAPNSGYMILSDNNGVQDLRPTEEKTVLDNNQLLIFYVSDLIIDSLTLNALYQVEGTGSTYNGVSALEFIQLIE